MGEVRPIQQNIDFADVMTTGETAVFLHCSKGQVRALTMRKWHPLPCINRGTGHKKQRIFLRLSVLRWMQEEEKLEKPVQVEKPKPERNARTA